MNRKGFVFALVALLALLSGCESVPVVGEGSLDDDTGNLGQETPAGDGDVYMKMAVEYYRRGEYDTALKKAKTAVEVDPGNGQAHNVIALIYDRIGEEGPAERHYKRAVSLQPRDSYIRNAYGAFLCKRGRYAEADHEFQRALENPLYRTPEVALTNAGLCAGKSDNPSKAEDYLRRALRYNSQNPQALLGLAQASFKGGNTIEARGLLRRYHELTKATPQSLWLGIQIERQAGDKDALATYELQLRSRFPGSDEYKLLQESTTK